VFGEEDDLLAFADLLSLLRHRVGRLIVNGLPTGVEVAAAMQHRGPYPATTDSRSTSVGTAAIQRFVRPLCFQNMPDALLPPELRRANPLGIWRWLADTHSKDPA
jgi:NADP-dependent aldehyde dehydrogenase